METSEDIRISLAGVQDKLAVVVNPSGRIGLPRGTTPSTHILKPASTERRGRRGDRLAYPALVANEAMCLTLARHAGIEVPELQVLNVDDEPALLIARYDRRGLTAVWSAFTRRTSARPWASPRARNTRPTAAPASGRPWTSSGG